MAKHKTHEAAEQAIRVAVVRKTIRLDLSASQLTALPDSLGQLTQLQELNLRDNQLTALPDWLGQLKQLQRLDLAGNQLTALPDWLGQLKQLQELYVARNRLTALPDSLGKLTQLQRLDLAVNQLTALPDSLGRLTQLQEAYLLNNQLTALPDSLGKLTQLQELYLLNNQLTALPDSLGQLAQLQVLHLAGNRLKALPDSLGLLAQLQQLYLSGNRLTALPDSLGQLTQLQRLSVRDNRLTALPDSLARCERLRAISLIGNTGLGIPPEILELSEEAWRAIGRKIDPDSRRALEWYFQSQAEPGRRLNEAKMLLVGQGSVGKTSLVDYLVHHKPCNSDQPPTEGINIASWDVQGKKGKDGRFERIDLHIWDFGGQEIMHATHQFFLTRRSLYLLVIDARAGEKESNIHYWLKIIQSYGGESPILVVVNKCDQYPHELNETRLMRDYPSIQGFIQTSCSTGQGMADLRREIGKQVRRLPHVFDVLPQSYFEVKAKLEQAAREKNYIPIDDYREICRRHKVIKIENQDSLVRFLHDLGVVLNFQDPEDPYGQNDPFVLNPEWVTGGVYAIINGRELKAKRDGLLTLQKLETVLNALPGYPGNRHDFIVRKMMQFELAYQIGQGKEARWLIPELLDPREPKNLDWKPQESLNFQYVYPVLPAGVICRFIVRMHQCVDLNHSWRSGTVLRIEGTTVLVRGDMENNTVYIAVQGAVRRRKEVLAVVREAFRYVHSTIPALAPEEQVPLPDHPSVAVPYDHLLKLEEAGETTHFPPGANRRYSVAELLSGVDSSQCRNERRMRLEGGLGEMDKKHVFMSYCHDNEEEARRLVDDLESAGELVWWDNYILGGRDYKEAIREAMKNAYAVVVCLSPELVKGRHRSGVYPELRDAIAAFREYSPKHSFIFPVRLAECDVPPIEIDDTRTLERIQYIDLFPSHKRKVGLQKLLESLSAAPEHP